MRQANIERREQAAQEAQSSADDVFRRKQVIIQLPVQHVAVDGNVKLTQCPLVISDGSLNSDPIMSPLQEEARQIEKEAQELQAAQAAFTARTAAAEADLSAREAAVAAAQSSQSEVCKTSVWCPDPAK